MWLYQFRFLFLGPRGGRSRRRRRHRRARCEECVCVCAKSKVCLLSCLVSCQPTFGQHSHQRKRQNRSSTIRFRSSCNKNHIVGTSAGACARALCKSNDSWNSFLFSVWAFYHTQYVVLHIMRVRRTFFSLSFSCSLSLSLSIFCWFSSLIERAEQTKKKCWLIVFSSLFSKRISMSQSVLSVFPFLNGWCHLIAVYFFGFISLSIKILCCCWNLA